MGEFEYPGIWIKKIFGTDEIERDDMEWDGSIRV